MSEENTQELSAEETPQAEESAPQKTTEENTEVSTESAETETPTDDTPPEPEKAKGVQKRIDELTRLRRDAERDRDYWRELHVNSAQQPQQPDQTAQEQPVTQLPVMPDKFDYEDDAQYHSAMSDYQTNMQKFIRHEAQQLATQQQQQTAQAQAEAARQQTVDTLKQKLSVGSDKYDDFDYVTNDPTVPWTPGMAEALVYTENTSDVAYMVSKDRELAAKISQMPPAQAAAEIARLDVKIGAQQKTTTNAPPPVKPVNTTSGEPSTNPDDLPIDEWVKKREAGEIRY
jgi:hypothetical protein